MELEMQESLNAKARYREATGKTAQEYAFEERAKRQERLTSGNKMEPCPFCGGEAEYEFLTDGKKDSHHVGCINEHCPVEFAAAISFRDKETAIEAWNTRVNKTPKT
jgi:Lar family restriction alleviation protein